MHPRPVLATMLALAAVPAALLAGCGAGDPGGPRTGTPPAAVAASSPSSAAPPELAVACAPAGVRVAGTAVAATAAGVVLRITSTAAPGTYLDLGYGDGKGGNGKGEGFPAPASGVVTVSAPPGRLTLTCHEDRTRAATVTVTDPGGHWRAGTLDDAGCAVGAAQPSWVGGSGHGSTARAAVLASVAALHRVSGAYGGPVATAPAPIGYPDAPRQTWIVSVGGRPAFTEAVEHAGAAWSAGPDLMCSA